MGINTSAGVVELNPNPITKFLENQGVLVLDGGLATTLEAGGADLNDDLWSAKLLLDDPAAIKGVHLDFLHAGADCIVSSTYQASLPGLIRRGLSEQESLALIRYSVDLAVEARDGFWDLPANREGRMRPMVAASVGPYGAYLADGSEYTGRYGAGVGAGELDSFHRLRWQILTESSADVLACETIPTRLEAEVLLKLITESSDSWAWMGFACRDGLHINDGTPIKEMAGLCESETRVAAVGINCTAPEYIPSLIAEVRSATNKPVIVYPNSGDVYVPSTKTWSPVGVPTDWATECARWAELGASCIGGCCRLGPRDIDVMRQALVAT
ncbi:MAG: homocysteine S-methyltransferase [Rhodothermia bacterium]